MKVYKSKNGYFYKQYKNGEKKRISEKEYKKKISKNMKGGAPYKKEDLISTIMKEPFNLQFIKIETYEPVGMGNLHKNVIPIATNGIATCMGIGTHIDGINYFSHASPIDYCGSLGQFSLIYEWKRLLEQKIDDINSIYLYTPLGIPKGSLPFLVMLNNLKLIDKTKYVKTIVHNPETGKDTDFWNTEFMVGISESGAWGYDYSVETQRGELGGSEF